MNDIAQVTATPADKLDLGFMPIEDAGFSKNPYPILQAVRAKHPWLAKCEVGYIIHGYQAMKDLMWMDDKLRTSNDSVVSIMGAEGTLFGDHIGRQILAKRGPDHARIRGSVAEAFTPRNVNRYRALMRDVISKLLDEWAPAGRMDVAEFAAFFPITIACALVGAPAESVKPITAALETFGRGAFSLDPTQLPAMDAALHVTWDFVDGLVVERERTGGGDPHDILNVLISAKRAGQIDDTELRDLLMFIVNAGYDTSKNMITLIMYTMLDHPDQWARCAEDPIYCRRVVEEQFRYRAVASPYRTVAEDLVYRDVRLPKDTLLVFPLPLAGHDPDAFPEPDAFDPEREKKNGHIGFGRGLHMCLGQHLAKAQIEEGIHMIAQRVLNPKLDGEVQWRGFAGVWGLKTLPIKFTPGERRAERADMKEIDAAAEGARED
jgi:cytochrome P450